MFNFLRDILTSSADKALEKRASLSSERFKLSREARLLFEDYVKKSGAYPSSAIREQRASASRSAQLDKAKQKYFQATQMAENENAQYDLATGKYQLGMITLLQGDFDDAIALFIEALEKCTDVTTHLDKAQRLASDCHFHLGYSYLKNQVNLEKKDIEQARREFEAALEIDRAASNVQSQMLSLGALNRCDKLLQDCEN